MQSSIHAVQWHTVVNLRIQKYLNTQKVRNIGKEFTLHPNTDTIKIQSGDCDINYRFE